MRAKKGEEDGVRVVGSVARVPLGLMPNASVRGASVLPHPAHGINGEVVLPLAGSGMLVNSWKTGTRLGLAGPSPSLEAKPHGRNNVKRPTNQ